MLTTVIIITVSLCYVIVILLFTFGFDRVKEFKSQKVESKISFSIIIPFRNEAENLSQLLRSIQKLKYSINHFELLFIDDSSQDDSVKIIHAHLENSKINYQIFENIKVSPSPKKSAVDIGIKNAKYDWIITTDADCTLRQYWLETFNAFIIMNKVQMIVGPVIYSVNSSFVEHFQLLDFLSLQSAAIGAFGLGKPFLCNGANLAYRKDFFIKLNGFQGNDHIASGDDIFLLQKAVQNYPQDIAYLKSNEAIVSTFPQPNISALVYQRMRWASKSSSYKGWFSNMVTSIILLFNFVIILALILSFFNSVHWSIIAIIFLIKLVVDFWCITKAALFYDKRIKIIWYLISSFIYPFFTIYIVFRSVFLPYKWKDRQFAK